MKNILALLLITACSSSNVQIENTKKQNTPVVEKTEISTEKAREIKKRRFVVNFIKKSDSIEVASIADLRGIAGNAGLDTEKAFEYILSGIDSFDDKTVDKTVQVINKMGDFKLDYLLAHLQNGKRNWRIVNMIGSMGVGAIKAMGTLQKIYGDSDKSTKIAIINAISMISPENTHEFGLRASTDKELDVALIALSSLDEKRITPEVILNLARILRSGDSYQRSSAMILLGNMHKSLRKYRRLMIEHIKPWLVFFKKGKDITLKNIAVQTISQLHI